MFASKNNISKNANATTITDNGNTPFIQPKLQIGTPGDRYEVEADRAADQILAKSKDNTPSFFPAAPTVQKNTEEELQQQITEDTEIQQKPVVEPITPGVQLKASVQKNEDEDLQQSEDPIQTKDDLFESKTINEPIQLSAEEEIQEKEEEIQEQEEEEVQTLQMSGGDDNSSLESNLNSSKGGGTALPGNTQSEMESGFGADFSSVKVHTDGNAVQMNQQLGSQAFTHRNHIYFNEGKYKPESDSGKHLLAHELTHTVQQGAASLQLKPSGFSSAPEMIQGFGILDLIPDWIINDARNIPGYTLFTVIISYDPLTGNDVDRNAINLVQGLLELIPVLGPAIFDKLQEYGILDRAFNWVNGQLSELGLNSGSIIDLLEEAWDEMSFPYDNAIAIITRKFNTLLGRIGGFVSSLFEQLMTWIKESLLDVAEPYLEENEAWSLLKKVIHYDPLRDREVAATTVEILEDFLILIGKETELEQMKERGTLQETADWLETQIGAFMGLLEQLRTLIDTAWEAIQPENLPNILDSFTALAVQAGQFLQSLWDFASTVAEEVLKLIKASLLGWLNTFAADIPGFTLLTVIIGRNPLTDEVVSRTVQNIIRGFMGLIPGGEAKYQELSESGVIPRAAAQIEALIAHLGLSAEAIVQVFKDIWNSFTIEDLLDPLMAFQRIVDKFGETLTRIISFVAKVVKVLVELLLEIMGIPPDMIATIIANAMSAFESIKNDPLAFLVNLMNALKTGFLQFLNNIGTHLLNGIQNWLFGTLADAGVQIPSDFSIQSILGMALEVLGITMENVLDRLEQRIGPERMAQIRSVIDRLTGIWTFVKDVMERGPIAIWEYIQSQISNLWNVIKEGIMGFIQEKVVQQAIGWLLSFLDVTGILPVIRGVQTVFNAIMSFVEKLREILEIVNSFVAGIAQIANGSIQAAASFLEKALADGIPIAISFLARQLGLGDISERIAEMIESTRGMINEAIDWLIEQALRAGTAFLSVIGMGGSDEGNPEEAEQRNSGEFTGIDEEFETDSGDDHTIYVRQNANGTYDIIIESTPTVFEDFIMLHFNRIESPTEEMIAAKDDALQKAREVDRIVSSLTSDEEVSEEDKAQVDQKLDELARVTILFMDAAPVSDIPEQNITWGSKIGSFGSSMSITYLKSKTTGSESSNLPFEENQILMQRKNTGAQKYYRNGHLLNANLHGPDDWKNLTPLSSSGNSRHLHQIEAKLKEALPSEGNPEFKAFRYVVTANYNRGINTSLINQVEESENDYVEANKETIKEIVRAERYVPTSLRAQSVELENVNDNWTEKSSGRYNITTPDIPNPIGSRPEDYRVTNERVLSYPVSYATASGADFLNAGFSDRTVDAILSVRGANPLEEIDTAEKLHPKILENISGAGGRVKLNTIKRKITF